MPKPPNMVSYTKMSQSNLYINALFSSMPATRSVHLIRDIIALTILGE
jgi:hypothetical protein